MKILKLIVMWRRWLRGASSRPTKCSKISVLRSVLPSTFSPSFCQKVRPRGWANIWHSRMVSLFRYCPILLFVTNTSGATGWFKKKKMGSVKILFLISGCFIKWELVLLKKSYLILNRVSSFDVIIFVINLEALLLLLLTGLVIILLIPLV